MKVKRKEVEVNMNALSAWIHENDPRAREKLSVASLVSMRTIFFLTKGEAPKLPGTRVQIARAMNLPEDVLFPPKKTKRMAVSA